MTYFWQKSRVFCYWYTEIFDGAWSGRNSVPPKLLFEGEVSGFIIGKKIFVVLFLMTLVPVTCLRIWNTHCTLTLWDKTLESFHYLCWWTHSLLLLLLHLIGTSVSYTHIQSVNLDFWPLLEKLQCWNVIRPQYKWSKSVLLMIHSNLSRKQNNLFNWFTYEMGEMQLVVDANI